MNKDDYMNIIKSAVDFDSMLFKAQHKITYYIIAVNPTQANLDEIKTLYNQLDDNDKQKTKDTIKHYDLIKDMKHNEKEERINTIINLLN